MAAQRSKSHAALGRAIREIRKERGLSQEELAFNCSLHRTYVGGIERGERNPSFTNIRRLADALSVTTSELMALAEEIEGR